MSFQTQRNYSGRETKLEYVFDKYHSILKNSILDVGADECHLKKYLPSGTKYIGVGLGGSPDIEVNLETEKLPFEDNSFHCVMCLDVLEHLDNTHAMFDELCRVTSDYVIISLPNPYSNFIASLFGSKKNRKQSFKYYGLPSEPMFDRHKWFFSCLEAERYICERAAKNNMDVIQIDNYGEKGALSIKGKVFRAFLNIVSRFLSVEAKELYYKTTWAVLKKRA